MSTNMCHECINIMIGIYKALISIFTLDKHIFNGLKMAKMFYRQINKYLDTNNFRRNPKLPSQKSLILLCLEAAPLLSSKLPAPLVFLPPTLSPHFLPPTPATLEPAFHIFQILVYSWKKISRRS